MSKVYVGNLFTGEDDRDTYQDYCYLHKIYAIGWATDTIPNSMEEYKTIARNAFKNKDIIMEKTLEEDKDLYELSINEDSRNGSVKSAKGKDIRTGSKNKFYSGNIYIPISGSTIAAGIHNAQYFDRDVYTDITQKARINEQRQQMTTNF